MEMLGESSEQELGFCTVKVEERHFGLVIAEHTPYALVIEIVVKAVCQTRIAVLDSDGHSQDVFIVQHVSSQYNNIFTPQSPHGGDLTESH